MAQKRVFFEGLLSTNVNLDFFDILMGYDGKSKGLPECRKPFAVLCFKEILTHFFDTATAAFAAV
jgi:hypothetical protein